MRNDVGARFFTSLDVLGADGDCARAVVAYAREQRQLAIDALRERLIALSPLALPICESLCACACECVFVLFVNNFLFAIVMYAQTFNSICSVCCPSLIVSLACCSVFANTMCSSFSLRVCEGVTELEKLGIVQKTTDARRRVLAAR